MPIDGRPYANRRPQRGGIRHSATSDSVHRNRYCHINGFTHPETQLYDARKRSMLSHAGAILSNNGCASVPPAWSRGAMNKTTQPHASAAGGFQALRRIATTNRTKQIVTT